MKSSNGPWILQNLTVKHHGYDWPVFAIRDSANHCLAVVGQVDRATAELNEGNAYRMLAAPALLESCKDLLEQLEAYEEKGWLGEAWRTRSGLRHDMEQARRAIALAEHKEKGEENAT